ncbi:hypothetical protein [Sinanaerobacter sp. ZZT-01]|uniref:hypothetical protein n=1 Tax=Sinanaerobacter sp. ZZT-01 TaxID=3111540 RepID=UPI002D76A3ED|nr:hypothetical protein [Sinanaerobacter sp. ZZT-01]WRR94532.1 hypothetical protein U5921_05290 [Sinanaerobacter sp. ZZT-01]
MNAQPICLNEQVKQKVFNFFEAYYSGDRLKVYSYLDTSFQRKVPLNYFLIHPSYEIDMGRLLSITQIEYKQDDKLALAECNIEIQGKLRTVVLDLKYDFGGWKLEGESVFRA